MLLKMLKGVNIIFLSSKSHSVKINKMNAIAFKGHRCKLNLIAINCQEIVCARARWGLIFDT